MTAKWTSDDVPGQQGRLAVVTGANTGLGFETARVLAARGASVVLAVRDLEKGKRAAARIAGAAPGADVMVQHLDLTSPHTTPHDVLRTQPDPLRWTPSRQLPTNPLSKKTRSHPPISF